MAIFLSRIKKVLNLGTKSITSNGIYNASSDGYDGYSQVTVNVSGGGGTPITPSNASPVALTSGNTVTPTAAGYAIESYNSVTPSNASPVALTSGDIDKMGGAGYAIESYDSKTPSDSTPPTVASGDIVKMGGAGYLYETEQSLKNFYRNKVLNGGYTSICSLSAFQSRVTINEGGMVADTVNHRVYLYVDFTANADVGSASDYAGLMLLNNISTDYYPKYSANSRNNTMPIITDETSTNVLRQFYFGYNTSSYANRICLSYGSGANAIRTGDRYIIYAAYTYQ